jgi:predicted dienelactone hydrolase
MRLIEIFILVAMLPPLVFAIFSRSRPKWLAVFPAVGTLLIVLHLFVEGGRWQMVPAYILTAVSLLFSIRWLKENRPAPRLAGMAALLGLFGWLIAVALPVAMPVPKLPDPTGPYAIGTMSAYLVDNGRPEIYTEDPDDKRELMVQIWYPAANKDGDPASYIENLDIAGPVVAEQFDLPSFLLNHINLTQLDVWQNVVPATNEPSFPVIIFSHGLTGLRMQNTIMVRELVSQGYIVAAIDHTYANAISIFPDGHVFVYDPSRIFPSGEANYMEAKPLVQVWADDISFLLDEMAKWQQDPDQLLNGRFNLDQVGVFGHSTGGGAAVQFCMQDGRCKAGLGLDSWVLPISDSVLEQGPSQPFMFLGTPSWLGEDNQARGRAIFNNLSQDGYLLSLDNTGHYDFTDLPILTPLTPQLGLSGEIDSGYSIGIQNEYVLAFFNQYLKETSAPLLTAPSAYPELMIELNLRP